MASAANRLAACLLLAWAAPALGQQLHKCVGPDGHVSWQDAPCAPGSTAEVRSYDPDLAGTPEQQERLDAERAYNEALRARIRPREAAPTQEQWMPQVSRPDRSRACESARAFARERRTQWGERLSMDAIRRREQHAERVCSTYANCTDAELAGDARMSRSHPRYAPHLDHDDDGIACE